MPLGKKTVAGIAIAIALLLAAYQFRSESAGSADESSS
jgi:hypothetical protein